MRLLNVAPIGSIGATIALYLICAAGALSAAFRVVLLLVPLLLVDVAAAFVDVDVAAPAFVNVDVAAPALIDEDVAAAALLDVDGAAAAFVDAATALPCGTAVDVDVSAAAICVC